MARIGNDDSAERVERVSTTAIKDAWAQTTEELEILAEQRREQGWDTVAIPAIQTAAVSRDAGPKHNERFGIVFVVPDNHADAFSDAFDRGEFPRFEAYRNEVSGAVFLVVEYLDPESETAILLAGQYERRHVAGMLAATEDEGVLFTHAKTLNGTVLGSFEHKDYAPLVPETVGSVSGNNTE
ncbi:uncharacterized protein Nmag_2485 [Natrialba magadii ATCC 43099]|uniref:Uncharacterized protein n=1 Tax=Natrialba magadii (strain ATCC 43099 / DSM 3394 / CCM 3739 / CIP 104546 / IAM 13178 / JCM 8861 / NBRC 102185 / NCIMB 2190 / MS3) TaxID=547559 RepID=D3SY74_NATMM|nr:hypothetical protein [Natrialba magadii]ADD06045.1 uncharacterized protein Nmag_2485 [Natrialba magadii ATCC 43099]ELY30958.1 hypothetical protein C500_07968 [Natrialba magadii ATCC 43099]